MAHGWDLSRFGRPVGSAGPLVGPLVTVFVLQAMDEPLPYPLGAGALERQFGLSGGLFL